MKPNDEKLNMWFSVMASILVHVVIILFVPATTKYHVTVYPVEFGEISQTFASTRQGRPTNTGVTATQKNLKATPQPSPKDAQELVKITEKPVEPKKPVEATQESVQKSIEEPVQKPIPESTPGPAREQTTEPIPEPVPEPTPEPVIKETVKFTEEAPPEELTPQPEHKAMEPPPEPQPQDMGRVLTGESDETIPIPETNPAMTESGGVTEGSGGNNVKDPNALGGTGEGEKTITDMEPEDSGSAEPEKPKGHQFGTGESLAINSSSPRYPKDAQNVDLVGAVKFNVSISKDGRILDVDITEGSGHSELDDQARMTILSLWEFRSINWPYKIQVTVSFKGEANVGVEFGGVSVLDD